VRPSTPPPVLGAGRPAARRPPLAPAPPLPYRRAGAAVRTARRRAGLSQHLLGLMTGTTQQAVSRWEQGIGAPESAIQRSLVEILGLPADTWSKPPRRHRP